MGPKKAIEIKNKAEDELNALSENVVKAKKPSALLEYMNLEKIRTKNLMEVTLNTLKELYLFDIRNGESLLWIAQNKNDDEFDGYHYTDMMRFISKYLYDLPLGNEDQITGVAKLEINNEIQVSDCPLDELFMWSILTYSGKVDDMDLIKYYWSLTSKPIACALAAMLVYDRFLEKQFINREFKEQIKQARKEFEELAVETLRTASKSKVMEAQDLILRENEYFYDMTALQIANEAKAEEFIGSIPVQTLLTDIWHGKLSSYVSSYRILFCMFFWPLIYVFKLFRYDYEKVEIVPGIVPEIIKKNKVDVLKPVVKELNLKKKFFARDLPFRVDGDEKSILRLIYFLNSPIIKYVHHFLMHMLMLMIFSYLILFDLYPLPTTQESGKYTTKGLQLSFIQMPMSELFMIAYTLAMNIGEFREIIYSKTFGKGFLKRSFYKIKHYLTEDHWNLFEILKIALFYAGLMFRVYPTTSDTCFATGETCTQVGKILYSTVFMMTSLKTLRYMILMEAFGPNYQMLIEMCRKLFMYIIMISILLVPYAFDFHTLIDGTEDFSLGVILKAFYKMMWTIFLQIIEIVTEIGDYPIQSDGTTVYSVTSSFLFISFPLYVLTCNILLFNLIAALFIQIVKHMTKKAEQLFRLMRYSNTIEFEHKTILPPPLNLIEFLIRMIIGFNKLLKICAKENVNKNTSFAIKRRTRDQEADLNQFEQMKKDEFLSDENNRKKSNKKDIVERKLRIVEKKIDVLQSIYEIDSDKGPMKKLDDKKIDSLIDNINYITNQVMTSALSKKN